MSTFNYHIVGRTPGVTDTAAHSGKVSARSPREAILAVLVAEFGDPDAAKPFVRRLCDGGWIDEPTLYDHFVELADDARSLCLDTGDHTFDIEVRLSIGWIR